MRYLKYLPWALIFLRISLGPVIVILGVIHSSPILFFLVLLIATLSDIYDGILARKLGIASLQLRIADSRADLVFWLCAALACYVERPDLVQEHRIFVVSLIAAELSTYIISFLKFKRFPSAHSTIAKLFGLSLMASLTSILCFHYYGIVFYGMWSAGVLANLEINLITLALPEFKTDIKSLKEALKIRKERDL